MPFESELHVQALYGRRFFGGYRAFQKTHRKKCKNQSGRRDSYKGRYGSFPYGRCGPHRCQRSDQGALRRITLLFPDKKDSKPYNGTAVFFCVLRVIGHFVLVFIPMKLDIVWFHRYFIFFLKR